MAREIKYYDVTEEQIDHGYQHIGCQLKNAAAAIQIGTEMGVPVEIHRYGEVCRYLKLNGSYEEQQVDKGWVRFVARAETCEQGSKFIHKFGDLAMQMLKARQQ